MISDLFDLSFTRFVTLRLLGVVYVLLIVAVAVGALSFLVTAVASGEALFILLALVGALLYLVVGVVLVRVSLEFVAVLFRLAKDVRAIRDGGRPVV